MPWIAKNSKTGITYGKKFSSIIDCQRFIDTELLILEYEFQKVFALELSVIDRLNSKKYDNIQSELFDIFNKNINNLANCKSIKKFRDEVSLVLTVKDNDELHDKLNDLAKQYWSSNNIIRCWNIEQERFATGFDF